MAPEDMARLELSEGQIIEIEGKRRTPARILSCDSDFLEGGAAKGILQIDGIIRDNAQVSIDDKVTVHRAVHHFAGSITLRPLTSTALLEKERDAAYIGSLFEGMPVRRDDRIRTTLFGSRICDFRVMDTRQIAEALTSTRGASMPDWIWKSNRLWATRSASISS